MSHELGTRAVIKYRPTDVNLYLRRSIARILFKRHEFELSILPSGEICSARRVRISSSVARGRGSSAETGLRTVCMYKQTRRSALKSALHIEIRKFIAHHPSYLNPLPLHPIYSSTLPKNAPSNLPTSLLKVSTSRQQSNGLRSFTLKQLTTSSLALLTP